MTPGIDRGQVLVAEAPAVHHPGRVVLDHHVDVGHQFLDQGNPFRSTEVDADAALPPILLDVAAGPLVAPGDPASGRVPVGSHLDLDDVGPHLRHQPGAGWSRQVLGEVEDGDPVEVGVVRQLVLGHGTFPRFGPAGPARPDVTQPMEMTTRSVGP